MDRSSRQLLFETNEDIAGIPGGCLGVEQSWTVAQLCGELTFLSPAEAGGANEATTFCPVRCNVQHSVA